MPKRGRTAERGYGSKYRRARAAILGPAGNGVLPFDPPCHWCGATATTGDHEPPLEDVGYPHLNLVPACGPCNFGRKRTQRHSTPSRSW